VKKPKRVVFCKHCNDTKIIFDGNGAMRVAFDCPACTDKCSLCEEYIHLSELIVTSDKRIICKDKLKCIENMTIRFK